VVLPDPPLVDDIAGIRLRPWTTARGDVEALVAAWADPAIAAANGVPHDASAASATRWLAADGARLTAGRCVDLVVDPLASLAPTRDDWTHGDDRLPVLGEVGLRNIDRVRRRAEISWWTAAAQRGRGVATAATRLLTAWALDPAGGGLVQVWARIAPANVASARVAASAGLEYRGTAAGTGIWARTRS
jgi:RimJ/RimL family protein N-acetyltransferase